MFELRNGSGDVAVQQSGVRPLELRRCATRCDVLGRCIQCVLEGSARAIPVTQHSLVAAAAEEHPTSSPELMGPIHSVITGSPLATAQPPWENPLRVSSS